MNFEQSDWGQGIKIMCYAASGISHINKRLLLMTIFQWKNGNAKEKTIMLVCTNRGGTLCFVNTIWNEFMLRTN